MSRNLVVKALVVVGIVMFFGAVSAKAEKTHTVSVDYTCLLPGGHQLKAGTYKVSMVENGKAVRFVQKHKVVAEVPCHCKPSSRKNVHTEVLYESTPNNQHKMMEMRLKGETMTIHFTPEEGM